MSNIVFSGSREGMTADQIVTLHRLVEQYATHNTIQDFHHGMSGESDRIAHYAARTYSAFYYIIGHPSTLEKWRINVTVDEMRLMKPPLDRNQDMIDEVGEFGRLICTPNTNYPLSHPSGTWSTAMRAERAGLYLDIIELNGEVRDQI